MPTTLNVADKPTLNSVKTDTDTLITRGGIRHNGTNPQVYDTTNDTWVDLPSGGSLSPTIIIKNHFYEDGDMDNLNVTISDPEGLMTTQTVNMGTDDYIVVDVPHLGEYAISCTFNSKQWSWVVNVNTVGGVDGTNRIPKIVSWATGTNSEIVDMVNAADEGIIDLVTDGGWAVGDTRRVFIKTISASGTFNGVPWSVGESHVAQNIDLVLMDAGDTSETNGVYADTAATAYQLVTPVKNKDGSTRTNPAFIVGVKDILSNGSTTEHGYMKNETSNIGTWNGSNRRNWCNGGFMGALPDSLRSIFKQGNVITAQEYNSSTNMITQDYCFLLAIGEISDYTKPASKADSSTTGGSNKVEFNALKQLQWYKTASNKIKKTNRGSGSAIAWWTRSPRYSFSTGFCAISNNGSCFDIAQSNSNSNISPALFI